MENVYCNYIFLTGTRAQVAGRYSRKVILRCKSHVEALSDM